MTPFLSVRERARGRVRVSVVAVLGGQVLGAIYVLYVSASPVSALRHGPRTVPSRYVAGIGVVTIASGSTAAGAVRHGQPAPSPQ